MKNSDVQNVRLFDLHQDILHNFIDRNRLSDNPLEYYIAEYLADDCRLDFVWSSIFPADFLPDICQQLILHSRLLSANTQTVRSIKAFDDLSAQDNRIGLITHIEGYNIDDPGFQTLTRLCTEFDVRSLSLSWNKPTLYAQGSYDDRLIGLSAQGKKLLRKLETLPVVLDLAHINERGFYEALSLYQQPAIVSHTAAAALFDHPRNLTDQQLQALRAHGSVVGLIFLPPFLDHKASISSALRHLDHLLKNVGEDHLAIGSDWGNRGQCLKGLSDINHLSGLYQLIVEKFGQQAADKILSHNARRILELNLQI